MRSETEIQKVADTAADEENKPTRNRTGMTYENGVRAALDWVIDDEQEETPLE